MAKLALKRSFGQNLRMSLSRKRVIPIKIQADDTIKDRPFTLPPGEFKPKQNNSEDGCRVVEIGPGPGSLTRVLLDRYPKMTAIELDQRAISFLITKLPKLKVMHMDVLDVDWPQLAIEKGGALNIIANLPYYIVSQVLFSLADSHKAINKAVVTMQLEVAERVTANPNSKQYGIPSVVFQLYGQTSVNFKIPPSVFYPKPKVDSALVTIDFTKPHKDLYRVDGKNLRKVVTTAFQQRRKMMRQSLKELSIQDSLSIPLKWSTLRPEQLAPEQFLELTADLYGENKNSVNINSKLDNGENIIDDKNKYQSDLIWRIKMNQIIK